MELDFEDFIEEIKFQMTEYDESLGEDIILDWEERVRAWVQNHRDKKYLKVKSEDDIIIRIPNEDVMEEIAQTFCLAVKNGKTENYWRQFKLI